MRKWFWLMLLVSSWSSAAEKNVTLTPIIKKNVLPVYPYSSLCKSIFLIHNTDQVHFYGMHAMDFDPCGLTGDLRFTFRAG